MATVHRLSRQDARRVAVRAQLLTSERPPDLLSVVRRLTFLQLDPVSAVAPSADLVAWSRLGASYRPDERKAGVLTVAAIHQDVPFTREMSAAIDAEITSLAACLGLEVVRAG
jgi:uncharacterized protein YcaQ